MSKTAIIVLNWNGAHDTIQCIESLRNQKPSPTIILIDNASSDDSVARLEEYLVAPQIPIVFIKNKTNNGYAGGINTGLRYALDHKFEFVGVLNPDAIADKNWLSSLSAEFLNKKVGIVAGSLLNPAGDTIDSTGEIYSIWGLPAPRYRGQGRHAAPKKSGYIFGASGGALLFRTAVLRKIGLFDERFFMYFEDVDMSFRCQLAGYKVRYTPKAIAYHNTGSSSRKVRGLTVYMTFKNTPMLLWKNVPRQLLFTIVPRFFVMYFLLLASAIVHGSGIPAIKGLLVSFLNIPHVLSERRKIQKSKVASSEYISSIMLHDIPVDQIKLREFRGLFSGVARVK